MKEYWIVRSNTKPSNGYIGEPSEGWTTRSGAKRFDARADAYRAVADSIVAFRLTVVRVTVKSKRPEPIGWLAKYINGAVGGRIYRSLSLAKDCESGVAELFPIFRVRRWETP